MDLFDTKHGHLVGSIDGKAIMNRWGNRFAIEGYAVIDHHGDVVGSFVDGFFANINGEVMAEARAAVR